MKTHRVFIAIGLALTAFGSACTGICEGVAKVFSNVIKHETQAVGMARLGLTLALWHTSAKEVASALRADMRASGNGAVFNTMRQPTTIGGTC